MIKGFGNHLSIFSQAATALHCPQAGDFRVSESLQRNRKLENMANQLITLDIFSSYHSNLG